MTSQTAFEDAQDGIDVLKEGAIFPAPVTRMIDARNRISQAQFTSDPVQRRALIQQAIARLTEARGLIAATS